jgi:AcrR family transcriptional regulator
VNDVIRGGTRSAEPSSSPRGHRTREHLIDVAESLYGDRGREQVSLNEIRIAAGQRNSSAMQFHFTDEDGLWAAIVDRHLPRLMAIQRGLFDRMILEGRARDPRSLVEVLLRPSCDYLALGPSERAWIKLVGQRGSRPGLATRTIFERAPDYALTVGSELHELLCERMPEDVAIDRLFTVTLSFGSICADRARVEDTTDRGREPLPLNRWTENLIDMAFGALFAPATEMPSRPEPG